MAKDPKIVIACTFRDFDGSTNDAIQREFLASLKRQTYRNFVLAVTNFKEKKVRGVLEESGLPFEFFQNETGLKVSITEFIYNATGVVESDDDILFYTNVDHVFPEHFLETLVQEMEPGGSLVSFPQVVYDNIDEFKAGRSLEANLKGPSLDRGAPDIGPIDILPDMFRTDPNHWLPDVVAVHGSLVRGEAARARYRRFHMPDIWPGISQNVMLGFLAPAAKRKNIVFKARYSEILNNYTVDENVDPNAQNYSAVRKGFAEHGAQSMAQIRAFAEDIGAGEIAQIGSPLCKLEQVAQYRISGTREERQAYEDYLNLWRLRYLIHLRAVQKTGDTAKLDRNLVSRMREFNVLKRAG